MVVIGVIASAIAIPLALIIPWFPSKGSVQAGNIRTLYDVLLITTIPIFVLVETVVLFSVWKFRMRPGQEDKDGPPIHGNTRLEVIWTAVPAILIVSLCGYAYSVLRTNEANKTNAMTVNVTARQFAFEFSYPQSPGKQVVSPELYLPEGRPVVFKLRSLDVIHSFFVPNFSEKLDAVPGIVTTLRVTPDVLGTYPVECTELCGAGHSLMRSSAHVLDAGRVRKLAEVPADQRPAADRDAARDRDPGRPGLRAERAERQRLFVGPRRPHRRHPRARRSTSAAAGQAVFTGSAGCSGCHTLAAASATGTVGPNLDVRLRTDCANPASQKIRGTTLQAMHRDRDHQALRVPADRLQRGNHAVELRSAANAGRRSRRSSTSSRARPSERP